MVVMTSCAPTRAFRTAGMNAHAAPKRAAPIRISGTLSTPGSPASRSPSHAPASEPSTSWPLAPMLNRFARNAKATASPVKMSGVARMIVSPICSGPPKAPWNRALNASTGSLPVAAMIIDPITRASATESRGTPAVRSAFIQTFSRMTGAS